MGGVELLALVLSLGFSRFQPNLSTLARILCGLKLLGQLRFFMVCCAESFFNFTSSLSFSIKLIMGNSHQILGHINLLSDLHVEIANIIKNAINMTDKKNLS